MDTSIPQSDLQELLFYTWAACGFSYRTVRELLARAEHMPLTQQRELVERYRKEFPGRAGV